ncbi:MAG: hypothetical protein ACLUPF_10540 [Dorea sp.]
MAYTERQLLQERQATVLLSTELSNMFNRAMKSVTQELEREYEQERKKAKRERENVFCQKGICKSLLWKGTGHLQRNSDQNHDRQSDHSEQGLF